MQSLVRFAFLLNLLAITLLPVSQLSAQQQSSDFEAAMERAGENRDELQRAVEQVDAERQAGMMFLIENMPDRDLTQLTADFLIENVNEAYDAFEASAWNDQIPHEIFLNNILPYASINERRDNWRKDFRDRFQSIVAEAESPAEAAALLNQQIFPLLKVRYSTQRNRADQGPYESIDSGLASCTGLTILLIDACRSVGVPARFAGTPRWSDDSGNHSWVEIWDDGWHFTGAAEPTGNQLDRGWFVGRAAGAKRDEYLYAIYAVSFKKTPQHFPMVWARNLRDVYAVNVTDRYTTPAEPLPEGMGMVRFRAFLPETGRRVIAEVQVIDSRDEVVFSGKTNDERFDANDHLTAQLVLNEKYRVTATSEQLSTTIEFSPEQTETLISLPLESAPNTRSPSAATKEGEETLPPMMVEAIKSYFESPATEREEIEFDPAWNEWLLKHFEEVEALAWSAYSNGSEAKQLREDRAENQIRWNDYTSPYVLREVGEKPAEGWPLFIAMHGGGGVPSRVNDQQWRVMQIYYQDQEQLPGYLYLALRAPTDEWNGFYTGYNLPLTDRLIKQLVISEDVNPNRVYLMGYSHGGYGAFYIGRQMADRFAAVHASAAAPSIGNEVGKNLRNTRFTFMIGETDTRYERLIRCQSFGEFMTDIQADPANEGDYPVLMELKEGHGHTGLPDRNKISEMYEFEREPLPHHVTWIPSNNRDTDFYWLELDEIQSGQSIDAVWEGQSLTLTTANVSELTVCIAKGMVDTDLPISIRWNDKEFSRQLIPALSTYCASMVERGDRETSFLAKLELSLEE